MEMKMLKHQKSEFLMRVGKHEAKVRGCEGQGVVRASKVG